MSGVTAVSKPARTRLLHVAEDVGSGPVVLLIHGIASTAATFTHLTPLLAANHRVISIELLGFGESPDGTTYSIEEHVDWLERTIRSLKLKSFTVIGHSLGGLLMARYARRNPNRVERLIMVNPPIFLDPEDIGDRTERLAAMRRRARARRDSRRDHAGACVLPVKTQASLSIDRLMVSAPFSGVLALAVAMGCSPRSPQARSPEGCAASRWP